MRAFFITIFVLILGLGGVNFLVWPNTFLSQTNISFWPKPMVRKFLEKKRDEALKIKIGDEEKTLTRTELGINFKVEETMKKLSPSSVSALVDEWGGSLSRLTFILPSFEVASNFEEVAKNKLSQPQTSGEKFEFDKEKGVFVYKFTEKGFALNTDDLAERLKSISQTSEILIDKVFEVSELEKRVGEANKKMKLVINKPLTIVVDGSKQESSFSEKEIINLVEVETSDNLENVNIGINRATLTMNLEAKGLANFSTPWVSEILREALVSRFKGGESVSAVLGIDTGPNSDGNISEKYIEVDISQQKLYFFEKGEVFKSYSVSTGQYYPTPAGSYKILNKSPLGYSGIFKVWMPYWMAFDYRRDIGAYLGIHELPYMLVGGEKIYRFGNYIGSKKTGGCIALAPGDSKEVFDKTTSGMDLVIFE